MSVTSLATKLRLARFKLTLLKIMIQQSNLKVDQAKALCDSAKQKFQEKSDAYSELELRFDAASFELQAARGNYDDAQSRLDDANRRLEIAGERRIRALSVEVQNMSELQREARSGPELDNHQSLLLDEWVSYVNQQKEASECIAQKLLVFDSIERAFLSAKQEKTAAELALKEAETNLKTKIEHFEKTKQFFDKLQQEIKELEDKVRAEDEAKAQADAIADAAITPKTENQNPSSQPLILSNFQKENDGGAIAAKDSNGANVRDESRKSEEPPATDQDKSSAYQP